MDVGKFEVLRSGRGAPARIAKSRWIVDKMEPIAEQILNMARNDSNVTYSNAVYRRVDRKNPSRVRWIITLPPALDLLARRVEAKRGTMGHAADSVK